MDNTWPTLSIAYQHVLADVLHRPEYISSPRGLKIKEILGYQFAVSHPTDGDPIVTGDEERNRVIADYTRAEFKLYDSLTRDVEEYARASAFWRKIKNPDNTINSAYGYLLWGRKICGNPSFEIPHFEPGRMDRLGETVMRTPWEWAMESLKADKDTRQAIMHFNTPDVLWLGNKDVVCTLTLQFFIRNESLQLFVDMRSNDAVRGLVYDAVWFSALIFKALKELKPVYPNLHPGRYVHYARSMHIYEPQWEMAEQMLGVRAA